ncbi:hypothetical protein AB4M78_08700 [Staphylococcus pasteuri]|uniref:hypothetical protein n=1 Tax=Staphylococcus pasteuri TaxID=45972 RepID=UPI0034C6CC9C
MTRHPIVRMYDLLKNDSELAQKLPNKIFTFVIPEGYQKTQYTPFIRITEILMTNTLYRDGDSEYYRFLFAVETFGNDINTVYSISERVVEVIKGQNGRCYNRNLSKEDDLGLFNQMLEFEIILPIKEQ